MKREIYDIFGMHCASCASAVERVTSKLSGVKESSVNLPMNRLTIYYDERKCQQRDIIGKVEKAGFKAVLHTESAIQSKTEKDTKKVFIADKVSLITSLSLAGILVIFSMGQMLFPAILLPDILSINTHPLNFALIQLILCMLVLFLERRFFIIGFKSLFNGTPNMDTLVAVSATASFSYSLVMTFLIADNPHFAHNLYYESAAVVVALVSVGKYLEESNKQKTKSAITKLMKLTPETAVLVDENGQSEVPVSRIKIGNTILVKPGSRIPLDGIITDGKGSVDESMLTGESLPVEKMMDSEVSAGSVSVDGALYVKVTRIGADTTLSKIIKFVEEAQSKKAPIARAADKVSAVFVPIAMIIAIVSAVIWLIAGAEFSFALKIFTSVLVIACPCAMGLATPTSIIVGTGIGAQHGILIRNGEALETTHKVTVAVFDKTGTITEGKPVVTDIISDDNAELLIVALSLENLSNHPISKAVCEYALKINIEIEAVSKFENITGKGLKGTDGYGKSILAGNAAFIKENGVDISCYTSDLEKLTHEGKTVIIVTKNNKVLGLIAVADTIKPDAEKAISSIKQMDIKTILLTGDNKNVAEFIGKKSGVDEIVSEVLPTEKANIIKKYQATGATVMMVGDGINDAPALTQADVGCAIGNGSDIAIDSADIILMKSELSDVYKAMRLSRFTIRNIRQNLFWAFCYNIISIPIAAGALYSSFDLLLSPMIGAIAMSLSSLFVVTNALRLKRIKL